MTRGRVGRARAVLVGLAGCGAAALLGPAVAKGGGAEFAAAGGQGGRGVAGRTQKFVSVRHPNGTDVEVGYYPVTGPEDRSVVRELENVDEFEVMPQREAEKALDLIVAWSATGIAKKRKEAISDSPDSVDATEVNLLTMKSLYQLERDGPISYDNTTLAEPFHPLKPLISALCQDVYKPYLLERHGLHEDCQWVFVKKYDTDGQKSFRAHMDDSVYTFNVALTKYDVDFKGAELFQCRQLPSSYAQMLGQSSPYPNLGGEYYIPWWVLSQPPQYLRKQTIKNNMCAVAKTAPGTAAAHFGARLHGVLPIEAGTRYSLIAFMGHAPDGPTGQNSYDDPVLSGAMEPLNMGSLDNLSETNMMQWLTGLAAWNSEPTLFSNVYGITEYALLIERFLQDPDKLKLVLHGLYNVRPSPPSPAPTYTPPPLPSYCALPWL